MAIGVLQLEVHIPTAQSLKDKRAVMKSLREQIRGRFNVSVADLDPNEKWQRATIGIAAIGSDRPYVEALLRKALEWTRETRLVNLIGVEEEYL